MGRVDNRLCVLSARGFDIVPSSGIRSVITKARVKLYFVKIIIMFNGKVSHKGPR